MENLIDNVGMCSTKLAAQGTKETLFLLCDTRDPKQSKIQLLKDSTHQIGGIC